MASKRIAIVGAGIGGLTTANALIQKGFAVKVFDQTSKFVSTAGAGFGLSPNGQICLASLGLHDRLQAILHPLQKALRIDHEGKINQKSDIFQRLRDKTGFSQGGCLRADLVDVLLEPLVEKNTMFYSHKLTNVLQHEQNVTLNFEGKSSEEFDLVIGADGIHSRVAEVLDIDHSPPIFADANVFYGVVEDNGYALKNPLLQEENRIIQSPGPGEFIFFRCGPKHHTVVVWAATYPSSVPPPRGEWGHAETSKELQSLLPKFSPSHPIHELAACSERLLHFGLFYRKHKSVWFKERACLLGDSCHATLPFVGQGANQAIEDAIVLSNCLASFPSHTAAFQEYYRLRYDRTRRIVNVATVMNKLYHSQNIFVQWFLEKLLTRVLKGGLAYKRLEKEIVDYCPVKNYDHYR